MSEGDADAADSAVDSAADVDAGGDRDVSEILDKSAGELTDRELMIALGALAQKRGEAEQRSERIRTWEQQRERGLFPALRGAVRSATTRLSPERIEDRKASAEEQEEAEGARFEKYLAEATARFDDTLGPTDHRGFW